MACHIPFVYSPKDLDVLNKYYPDSPVIRVSLLNKTLLNKLRSRKELWIDPAVDMYHNWSTMKDDNVNKMHLLRYDDQAVLGKTEPPKKRDAEYIQSVVSTFLEECNEYKPQWLSIPQLPYIKSVNRIKLNRVLVGATLLWKQQSQSKVKLILPVVLKDGQQSRLKSNRDRIIKHVCDSCDTAGLHGVWVVDCSLDDQSGSRIYGEKGLPKIIELHSELRDALPSSVTVVAGPYWGVNLLLWVRGLVDNFAIGLGKGYRYYVPGAVVMEGKSRIALSPFRRQVVVSDELESWLKDVGKRLPKDLVRGAGLDKLVNHYARYSQEKEYARRQVAEFYRDWINQFQSVQPQGRALALYQDLSNAYVVGKQLPKLPRSAGKPNRPEKVAQQLMLNCL